MTDLSLFKKSSIVGLVGGTMRNPLFWVGFCTSFMGGGGKTAPPRAFHLVKIFYFLEM